MRWLSRARGDRDVVRRETGARRLRPARDVLSAERDGVAVLLDLRRDLYLGLDEVGTSIWREIESGTTPDLVVERLAADFDAPVELIRSDAEQFLAELVRRRLVVT